MHNVEIAVWIADRRLDPHGAKATVSDHGEERTLFLVWVRAVCDKQTTVDPDTDLNAERINDVHGRNAQNFHSLVHHDILAGRSEPEPDFFLFRLQQRALLV